MLQTPTTFWRYILIALVLGFVWPTPGLWLRPSLTYLLMLMMFLSCLRIDFADLKDIPRHAWRYGALLLFIFIIPTVVVFAFRGLFDGVVFVGLALAAASPSAISVVFLSDLFHGQPTKALATTVLAHLISPLVTPILVWSLARQIVQVDFLAMVLLIAKVVLLPLLLAQLVRHWYRGHHAFRAVTSFNAALLVLLIWGILAPARSLVLVNAQQFLLVFGVVAVVLACEFLAGVWLGRNRSEDTTWVITDSYKNFTLSSVLALSLFGPLAVLGSVAFTIANNLLLIPLPGLVRRFQSSRVRGS